MSGTNRKVVLILIPVLALSSLWGATEFVAWRFAFQPALGDPFLSLHGFDLYSPWAFFGWFRFLFVPGAAPPLLAGTIILMTGGVVATGGLWYVVNRSNMAERKSTLHGSAHWARPEEIRKTGLLSESGVYVGAIRDGSRTHYLRHDGPEHLLAFAPTRSGKGVGLVIPTLLTWPHSVLVHDIKGENWALTAGWRQKELGSLCLKFDPTDASGGSCRFNPLSEIRIGTDREIQDVQNIATMIVDPDGKGLNDHWAKTGFALLVGAILHVLYAEKDKTLRGVARFISNPSAASDTEFLETMKSTQSRPRSIPGDGSTGTEVRPPPIPSSPSPPRRCSTRRTTNVPA